MTFTTETSGNYKLYKVDGNVVLKACLYNNALVEQFDRIFQCMQNCVS